MMWIFGIVLISGMKALLCKGFSLGGFLLLFWLKGRQLRFNSDEWDSFFISLPERKLQKYVICIYLVAAMFSLSLIHISTRSGSGQRAPSSSWGVRSPSAASSSRSMR